MAIVRERRRSPSPNIVPLIDIMFTLVAFLLVSTTFRTEPLGIDVDLPRAATGTVQQQAELRITVTQQGTMFVNGVAVSESDIQARVRSALLSNPNTIVIISADRRVSYDYVVRAIDAARLGGAGRLALSVERLP
ncbi:MAG: biopolymer transporter ExbD [Limnochordales bacterium]